MSPASTPRRGEATFGAEHRIDQRQLSPQTGEDVASLPREAPLLSVGPRSTGSHSLGSFCECVKGSQETQALRETLNLKGFRCIRKKQVKGLC